MKLETANTGAAIGWCLEPNDLAVSKLAAGRDKDLAYVEVMVRRGLVSPDVIRHRLAMCPALADDKRRVAEARLSQWHMT